MDWKDEHPEYKKGTLNDAVPASPWLLWEQWQEDARKVLQYTNEIILSTASADGTPSARMILLKYVSEEKGFCWFSNRNSRKGRDLAENPRCQMLWYCKELQRQARIYGTATEISRAEVKKYALARPRRSQLSAYISRQSRPVQSQRALYQEYAEAEKALEGSPIPVHEEWTGYSLRPVHFEFWQGRSNRLHDRILYALEQDGKLDKRAAADRWKISRLYP